MSIVSLEVMPGLWRERVCACTRALAWDGGNTSVVWSWMLGLSERYWALVDCVQHLFLDQALCEKKRQ